MKPHRRLLLVTFIENFATILLERGIYFYTHERMAFTKEQNLWLALVVKNASVDAGGVHEGLIGAGFAIGPTMGLIGHAPASPAGGYINGHAHQHRTVHLALRSRSHVPNFLFENKISFV